MYVLNRYLEEKYHCQKKRSHVPQPNKITAVFEPGWLKGHITTSLLSCHTELI